MDKDDPPDALARKLAAKRANERIKHVATFFNALGIGTIGAGVIVPATKTPIEVALISLVWLASGFALHLAGHAAYAFLQREE